MNTLARKPHGIEIFERGGDANPQIRQARLILFATMFELLCAYVPVLSQINVACSETRSSRKFWPSSGWPSPRDVLLSSRIILFCRRTGPPCRVAPRSHRAVNRNRLAEIALIRCRSFSVKTELVRLGSTRNGPRPHPEIKISQLIR